MSGFYPDGVTQFDIDQAIQCAEDEHEYCKVCGARDDENCLPECDCEACLLKSYEDRFWSVEKGR